MANGKSGDTRGVVAELLKLRSDSMIEVIAVIFSDILDPRSAAPQSWKETRLKVLFKKGDRCSVDNYRPIAVLPILYKLSSKMCASESRQFCLLLSP